MRASSSHSRFFSSLRLVEDRLASESSPHRRLENDASPIIKAPPLALPSSSDHQLTSPIFLDFFTADDGSAGSPCPQGSSGPPPEFLSTELSFPAAEQRPQDEDEETPPFADGDRDDSEIDLLMSLLGLSSSRLGAKEVYSGGWSCSDEGFYAKIAGVEGPKCGKERRRLEGWIEYYYTAKKEPARLAHLLLAKAACLRGEDEDVDSGLEFPVTVEEYLEHDPPGK